jgi:NAD(P)-dependent dehydrogenase (short-subunit alcohol dehydrogenase family)
MRQGYLAAETGEDWMITINGRTALITGSSRGIGRGIALKLAECGVKRIGVHYLKNRAAADDTAGKLRERGAEPLLIQADVTKVDAAMPGSAAG